MKKSYYFLLLCSVLSFWRCDLRLPLVSTGLDFSIFNATSDTVTWYIPDPSSHISSIGLPSVRPEIKTMIVPKSDVGVFHQTTKSNNYFDELPTDTLHIFILNYNNYKDKPWTEIVANNLNFKRIMITEDSLEALGFQIVID